MAATAPDVLLLLVLTAVTVTDLRERIVPDRFLVAATAAGLPLFLLDDPSAVPERAIAGAGAAAFLLAAVLIRPGAMGLGDVKLAAVLGLYLGRDVAGALLVAFLTGAVAGAALIARHGWRARSRAIPFAPFLALGATTAIVA